jgi:hypothetical protein
MSAKDETKYPVGTDVKASDLPAPYRVLKTKHTGFIVEQIQGLPSDIPQTPGKVVVRMVDAENIVIDVRWGIVGSAGSVAATFVIKRN